jgi:hypothetical protein
LALKFYFASIISVRIYEKMEGSGSRSGAGSIPLTRIRIPNTVNNSIFFSFFEKRIVVRGQGHRSWVSVVTFDLYNVSYGDVPGDWRLPVSYSKYQHALIQCHNSFVLDVADPDLLLYCMKSHPTENWK